MANSSHSSLCLIFSAPSGTGKTTILELFLKRNKDYTLVKSYTTRPKRFPEEEEYIFVNHQEFQWLIKENMLLEWEELFGYYYGTPKVEGYKLVFNVDVFGKAKLSTLLEKKNLISIFLLAPSMEELKRRLEDRLERLNRLKIELAHADQYDHQLVNHNLLETVQHIETLVKIKLEANAAIASLTL